jgi:hypothetical protein
MTEDADVATPKDLPKKSQSLDEELTSGGYVARLSGEGPLPVTKYYPEGDESGLYVEFIAAQIGGFYNKRTGKSDDLLEVAGITAQKLRYVDLLLFEPWKLRLSKENGFDVGDDELVIQLANPASYLAQKVLTLNRRADLKKRPKDALYIHDTLTMFGEGFDALQEQGLRVLNRLPERTQREFHELRTALFQNKDLTVSAAAIAKATGRANPPTAEMLATVCTVGLEKIFAP